MITLVVMCLLREHYPVNATETEKALLDEVRRLRKVVRALTEENERLQQELYAVKNK